MKSNDYASAFNGFTPPDPMDKSLPLPEIRCAEDLFLRWKNGGVANSIALVGNRDGGAAIALRRLKKRYSRNVKCTSIQIDRFSIAHDGLAGALGAELGAGRSTPMDDLIKLLAEADIQAVFLNNCHNLFIRRVGGFEPLFDLQHLISSTRGKVLWVTSWGRFTWYFLDKTIQLSRYFDCSVSFAELPFTVIEQHVKLKHESTGRLVEFACDGGAMEIESGKWLPAALAQSLKSVSGGDIRAACSVWLRAVKAVDERKIRVGGFPAFDRAGIEELQEEEFYILCSLLYHEEIELEYLAEDMNLTELDTRMLVDHLVNSNIVCYENGRSRCSIEAAALPAVVSVLDRKNLILIKETNGA